MSKNQGSGDDKAAFSRTRIVEFAHDLNNLLLGIMGNASLLLTEDFVKPGGKTLVEQMLECTRRARKLTDQLTSRENAPQATQASIRKVVDNTSVRSRDTVLVVDDESVVRTVSASVLERAGFRVLTAASGEEGVNAFRKNQDRMHCVVLDFKMPVMNGEAVLEQLRMISPGIKILLMSGYNDREVLQGMELSSITGFIHKPFEPADLLEVISKLN